MMSQMSVFNLDWSGYARGSDIEKSATKIASAVEKASQKITADESKNSQKLIESVKTGSEKIIDAVGKIKTTNNSNQTAAPSAASAVSAGLLSVAESTAKLANHLRSHPNELGVVAQSAEAVGKKFDDLVDRTSEFAKSGERLRKTTAEVSQAAGWIGSNYPCGGSNQTGTMVPVNNVFSGGIFNAAAIAPPIVGNFSELLRR